MDTIFNLDITKTGYQPEDVFVAVLGKNTTVKDGLPVASSNDCYLDFKKGTLKDATLGGGQLPKKMIAQLKDLPKVKAEPLLDAKETNGSSKANSDSATYYQVKVPPIGSARLYISFGKSLHAISDFPASGPVSGKSNTVIYDKIEFDSAAHPNTGPDAATKPYNQPNPNVNLTSVDFYGLSYTVSAVDTNNSKQKQIGFLTSRDEIKKAFEDIAKKTGTDGNPSFFKQMIVTDADGNLVRIMAPKSPGPTDFGDDHEQQVTEVTRRSHFWRTYINEKCYVPNRTFTCYNKLYTKDEPGPIYYCKVDAQGEHIEIYTDKDHSQQYEACPKLKKPNNVGNKPDFSNSFTAFNQVDKEPVDFGFLLSANTDGTAAPHWASDPVAMAIMISICRGCMHMDKAKDWIDPSNWYTDDAPIFYYSSILHDKAVDNLAYAFSYDDIFGTQPAIFYNGYPNIEVTFGKV